MRIHVKYILPYNIKSQSIGNMFIRVFYSAKCRECINLWQVIYNEGIARMFIPVCLDNFNSKQIASMMSTVKAIPAIVVSAENQPSAVFEGPQRCSQWLTNFTLNRRRNMAQQVEQQRRLIQKAQTIAKHQDGTDGFTEAEMLGISDSYSYNATDLCQPKSFVMVGDEDKYAIMTPQIVEGKVDIETMKRQLAELDASRNADTQQFMKTMEMNQINAVINYNNM